MSAESLNLHKGIKKSIPDSENVTVLFIDAKEADDYFLWVATSPKSVSKLKEMFPNLRKLIIEDDFLVDSQIEAIQKYVAPLILEWRYYSCIVGRHGK
jgi:hypothetical protein